MGTIKCKQIATDMVLVFISSTLLERITFEGCFQQ